MSRITPLDRASILARTVAMVALTAATGQTLAASAEYCRLLHESLTDGQMAKYTLAQQQCDAHDVRERRPTRRPEAAHLRLFQMPRAVISVPSSDANSIEQEPVRALPPGSKTQTASVTSDITKRAVALAPEIDAAARRHNIDPLLLHAIAHVESRHNVHAISPAGARGLMQIMPTTGQRFGVGNAAELHDARTNLEISATYLKKLQERFGNDLPLVLAAYNAGEGAVEKHGRNIPPYKETQNYVREVLARYDLLSATTAKQANANMLRSN